MRGSRRKLASALLQRHCSVFSPSMQSEGSNCFSSTLNSQNWKKQSRSNAEFNAKQAGNAVISFQHCHQFVSHQCETVNILCKHAPSTFLYCKEQALHFRLQTGLLCRPSSLKNKKRKSNTNHSWHHLLKKENK